MGEFVIAIVHDLLRALVALEHVIAWIAGWL